jgi:phosphate transport system substrate-binding protein
VRRTRAVLIPAAAAAVALAAPAASQAATVTLSGSTTVYPLAVDLAKAYNRKTRTNFRILQGGSDIGVADAAAGRVSLGMSSRDPKQGDPGGITFYRIARDGICLITNKSNPVRNLSRAQVQALYTGSITNFSEVGGANRTVNPIARTAPSGTQDAFQALFLNPVRQSASVRLVASSGLVQRAVQGDPGGIGYVSLRFAGGTNAAAYNGVACTLRNAKSGTYPGSRNLYFIARGKAKGAAAGFVKFARSRAAAGIVARNYVPLR